MEMQGAVAIVTGGATGLGAACAKRLAGLGCNVIVNYSKSAVEAAETVARCQALGAQAVAVQADVADDAACRQVAQAALDCWGRIDALINNAGTTKFVPTTDLEGLDAEDFQRVFAVNVIGAYQMVRAVAPTMRKQGRGSVVNISSIASIMGVGSSYAYMASKGGINAITLGLARALGPEIRVNAVVPGLFESRWPRQGLGDERYEAQLKRYREGNPLKQVPSADDMAEVVLWFVTGGAPVTGEILVADSGSRFGAPTRRHDR
ncbi:MAG: SDR family oxidoreductase [Sneathiellaceae bacterium]